MKIRLLLALALATALRAASLDDAAAQARVDVRVNEIKAWAADPVVVAAVKAHNAALPADQAALTQDKWKALSVLDPLVRGFAKNEAGGFLKTKKADWVTEAFLSDAAGFKVAFLAKPSSWCHAGKPKHDIPLAGKTWQGAVEVDESSGLQQLQVAVPVIDDGKPIGSLVVGLSLPKI
jgi:hypothetical protein